MSGTPQLAWTQDIQLLPSGPTLAQLGDKWTIKIGTTPYVVTATAGQSLASIVDGFVTQLTTAGFTASRSAAGHLVVASADGTPLAIDPVKQLRAKAYTAETSTADPNDHYLKAIVDLAGDYSTSETWTITIDGRSYSTTLLDLPLAQRTLRTIASKLVDAVNFGSGDPVFRAVLDGTTEPRIRIEDKVTASSLVGQGGDDPFTLAIKRGGGVVKGVFDIDGANTVSGSTQVPVVLPQFQWFVNIFPWLKRFFQVTDTLDYTARLELQLIAPNGSVLATNLGGGIADAGSATGNDPFIRYTFTQPGIYKLKVSSLIDWASFTRYLGVPNTFQADGEAGVVAGQNYTLLVSLQRHETNAEAITLVGKTLTIVDGTGKGESGIITAYNAETQTYTLDRRLCFTTSNCVAPDATSRYQIAQSMTEFSSYQPTTDTYQIVLTSRPASDVIVDVSPQPTPTYNSAEAFDPASNYGQNNVVQVRVATDRARIALSGTAAIGESWNVTLNDGTPIAYSIATSADLDLAHVAAGLVAKINLGSVYHASIDPTNPKALIVTAATAFYAGFGIVPDTKGGADVSTGSGGKATVGLTGDAALGETWKLTIDGTTRQYAVQYGDSLATIAAKLGALVTPTSLYDVSVVGRVITVSRPDGVAVSASFAISPDSHGSGTATRAAPVHAVELERRPDGHGRRARRQVRRRPRRARLPAVRPARQRAARAGR